MPVVDQDDPLVGLVTMDDLLVLMAETVPNVIKLIKDEVRRESRLRKS